MYFIKGMSPKGFITAIALGGFVTGIILLFIHWDIYSNKNFMIAWMCLCAIWLLGMIIFKIKSK